MPRLPQRNLYVVPAVYGMAATSRAGDALAEAGAGPGYAVAEPSVPAGNNPVPMDILWKSYGNPMESLWNNTRTTPDQHAYNTQATRLWVAQSAGA